MRKIPFDDSLTVEHIKWFVNHGKKLLTADGKEVEVWEFQHKNDEKILSAWAKHFRNHYCLDTDIDFLRGKLSRQDYLTKIKFPCKTTSLGPGIRAGDFGEILVCDYLQYVLDYWIPRVRWNSKVIRDESPKGSDVIGFRFQSEDGISDNDVLIVFESKTKFSSSGSNRLQDAINDSAKDHLRIDESLNFIKQKLHEKRKDKQAKFVERFQNPVDLRYKEIFGAAVVYSDKFFDAKSISLANCNKISVSAKSNKIISHPKKDNLMLIIIKGKNMMPLVHELFRRAADEA